MNQLRRDVIENHLNKFTCVYIKKGSYWLIFSESKCTKNFPLKDDNFDIFINCI